MALTYYPGVCSPVLHPISDSGGSPVVIPTGITYVSFTQTAYVAVASPCGADIVTHLRPVVLTVPPGS
jgi:hypothetical protein